MERELGRVVDALPGLVWSAFPDGQIDLLNQYWADYTGLGLDASRGRGWQAAVHADDLPRLLAQWRDGPATRAPVESNVRLRGADGTYRWFLFSCRSSAAASDQPTKWSGLATEIDERMRAEETLRSSERRSRLIVDGLPVLLSTATPDGALEEANRHYLEYFGATLEELQTRKAPHSLHPDDRERVQEARRAAIEAGRPYEVECRRRRADGVYRWFFLRAFPLRDAAGRIMQWYRLQIDIEDQKRAEALLAGEKRLLEMVASGRPIVEILRALCTLVESTASGCLCSILLVDPEGKKPQEAVAPSLPAEFNDAVRGWPLDRIGDPCAMAAHDKIQVIVSDVATDARWRASWRALAQKHDLRSCWSTPMVSEAGRVLGTFALYQREPRNPSALELDLIAQFTNIASIAIERAQRDVALRQSEARRAEAERELQLMIDTIPAFVTVFRPDGEREYVNKTWRDNTGLQLADIQTGGWRTIVHPDDQERSDRLWRKAVATGEPLEIRQRIRRHDGAYRWHLGRRVPLRDGAGQIMRWYSVAIDIEEQKRAEDALREAEHSSRLILDSIPGLVAIFNPIGELERVNRQVLEYFGKTFEELKGWASSDVTHPEDLPRVVQQFGQAIASGQPFELESRALRHDGVYRWHQSRGAPLRDTEGRIIGWHNLLIDIDERKRAEEKAAEAERELQELIDNIPALVSTFTGDGQYLYINKQSTVTGIPVGELQGDGWRKSVHPDEVLAVEREWNACLASGQPFEREVRRPSADGSFHWYLVRRVPVRDGSGKTVRWYGIGLDIEDRKRAEEALRASEARLGETERELRATLDMIPTITWRAGVNGYVQQLNKRWFEYTGTTPEQVRGWRWKTCVHPDDLDQLVEVGKQYVTTETPVDAEARIRRFDGTYRWFLFRPAPARDEHGRVVGWYGTITDIEDRKRAEAKAIEAEREMQRAIDNIPVLVNTYNAEGVRLSVNKRALEKTGLSIEDMPDQRWVKAYHPDDRAAIEAQWRECFANGTPLECEVRTLMADGSYRWHWATRVPHRDESGKIIRWYGVAYDIEDRKRAEEALAASERNLKLVIDTAPVLIWQTRPDGAVETVNRHYLDFVGLSLEQLQGWGWTSAVHPDDLGALASTWQALLRLGQAGEAEARLRRHDGTYRWFLFRASALRDESGNIRKWYGVNIDIEDRKRAEEELQRSEAFLAKGQEASLTGTFSFRTATGKFIWSEQLYRIYEFPLGIPVTFELVGSRYHPEDKQAIEDVPEQVRKGVTSFDYGHRLVMPNGSIKHVHVVAHGVPDKNGNGFEYFGAVQDVTQRRLAEEARDKVRSELAHVTRAMSLGALTASIAHEVNQPLAGIITNASTCLRMLGADPPNIEGARETARRTIRDGNRAADVITRLRALFSKKAAATETLELNEATREVLSLVFSDLLRNRVILRAELDDEQPLPVTGDRVQLQQVILNLVRNASDAMNEVHDRPRQLLVRVDTDEQGSARLTVKDSGVGLEPQDTDRLFDAFYTTKSDGMGIGLSVSRSIIEHHGGKLWAEANNGPGATFSFSIPRQAASAGDASSIWTRPTAGANDLMRNA